MSIYPTDPTITTQAFDVVGEESYRQAAASDAPKIARMGIKHLTAQYYAVVELDLVVSPRPILCEYCGEVGTHDLDCPIRKASESLVRTRCECPEPDAYGHDLDCPSLQQAWAVSDG